MMLGNLDRQEISRTVLEVQIGSEIDLGGGQRLMTQVELDLVDPGTIFARQLGVGAPQIVGGDRKTALATIPLDHFVHGLGTDMVPLDASILAHGLKEASRADLGGSQVGVNALFDPEGDGDRAGFIAFAHQVSDHPTALAQLELSE